MDKSILQSKVFWFNVLTLAATVSGYLPPEYAAPVSAIVNIVLRFLTTQPVTATLGK